MIEGNSAFDNVVHVFDMSNENLREDEPAAARAPAHSTAISLPLRSPENRHNPFQQLWSPREIDGTIFVDDGVDIAMVQAAPIFDEHKDRFARLPLNHQMAAEYPERVIFCDGVAPVLHSVGGAIRQIEHQGPEMNARSFRFCEAHLGGVWRCDDPKVA